MNRWSTNNNNSRELRLRPPPSSSLSATSMRSGLRNSDSADRDDYSSLPPTKRRRHSYTQNSAHVHVSATVPNLVIAGIRPSQWPSLIPSSSSQPATNGTSRDRGPAEFSRSKRGSARQSVLSRSPRRRRATRDRSYAEYNSDDDSTSSSEAPLASLAPTPKTVRTAARTSPRQSTTDLIHGESLDVSQKSKLSNGTDDEVPASNDANSQGSAARVSSENADLELRTKKKSSVSANATPQPASRGLSPAASAIAEPAAERPDSTEKTDPNQLPETLPQPFADRPSAPPVFADKAAELYHERYKPVTAPAAFVDLLTSYDPSQRSTETLFSLAQATHKALVAWQDQYLRLDSKTAPAQNPPKRPVTGGRVPLEKRLFENAKEIELWGHILGVEGLEYQTTRRGAYAGLGYDAPAPAKQVNVVSAETGDGRRARRRGADAKLTDGVQLSDNEADNGEKRTRKPVRRFDVGTNGGGRRKRRRAANEDDDESGSEVTEAPTRRKRGRLAQIRDEDDFDSSWSAGEEGSNARSSSTVRPAPTRGRGGGRGRSSRGRYQARGSPVVSHSDLQAQQQIAATSAPDPALVASNNAATMPAPAKAAATGPRRQKAKSEKRSSSMTAWWAERKRKAQEQRLQQMRERGITTETAAPPKSGPPAHVTAAPPPTGGQALMHVAPHGAAPLAPEPPRQTAEYAPRSSVDHAAVHPAQASPPTSTHDPGYPMHYRPIHAMHPHNHHHHHAPPPPPPGHGHMGHQHPPPPPPGPQGQGQPQPHLQHQQPPPHAPPPHHHHQGWYTSGYPGMPPPPPPPYQSHPPPPGGAQPPGPQGPPQQPPPPPPHGHVLQPYGSFRIMNGR